MAAPNPTTWALTSLAPPPPPPPPSRAPAHQPQPQAKPNSDLSSLATTTMDLEYTPLAAIPSLRQYTKVNILAVVQAESNTIPTLNRKGHAQIKLCLRDSSLPRSAPYTTLMLFRHQPQDFAHAAQLLVEGSIVRIKSATVTCTPTNTHSMLIVGSNDYVSMSVTMGSSSPEIEARPVGIKGVTPLLLCGVGDQAKVNALREWWWSQTHAANLAGFSQIGMTQVVMPPPRPVFHPPAAHQYAAPPPPPPAAAAAAAAPLAAAAAASSSSSSSSASIAQARPIHPSIATTQTNCFYDLIVEIVQVKGFPGDTFMTALVTDYSAKSIAEIGTFQHTFGANAPVVHDHQGVLLDPHTLIPMLLFDEHKHFAETHCSAGTLVLVRNCRAAKAVSGSMERFELKMQGSRGNKQWSAGLPRMEVVSREDERCRPLMQRRSRMLETQNMPVVAEQLMDKLAAEGMPEIGTEGVEAKRRRIGALMVSNANANAAAESVIARPVPVSFTYIKHPYIPPVSLADILNSPKPNGKYRCRVRFTKVLPQKLVNCTRRMCRACMVMLKQTEQVCPKCASSTHTSFAFCMVFTLVDELGDTLDVLVNDPPTSSSSSSSTLVDSGRIKLFPGLVPTDLSTDQITSRSLLARLAYVLFGMSTVPVDMEAKVFAGQATISSIGLVRPEGQRPAADQVWCDVCIESYLAPPPSSGTPSGAAGESGETASGEAVVERQVKYRLFDTEMREPGL